MDICVDTDTPGYTKDQQLRVSPSSDLAGYNHETDVGRYATFFWQAASNSLYASMLLKKDPVWVPIRLATLVATDAKKNTPITAVNWSNGLKAAVYYLDDRNIIRERVSDDGGVTWGDGDLSTLCVPTRSFSDLTAVISSDILDAIYIRLYFQDSQNLIRELQVSVNEGRWHEERPTGYDKHTALGGTRIACPSHFKKEDNIYVTTQNADGGIQQFHLNMEPGGVRNCDFAEESNLLTKYFNRGTRLGYTSDSTGEWFYAYDSGGVTERVYGYSEEDWVTPPRILPTGAGISKILGNFIVMSWPRDMDCTSSEVHIFSMEESGLLWDYLVGLGTASSLSLL